MYKVYKPIETVSAFWNLAPITFLACSAGSLFFMCDTVYDKHERLYLRKKFKDTSIKRWHKSVNDTYTDNLQIHVFFFLFLHADRFKCTSLLTAKAVFKFERQFNWVYLYCFLIFLTGFYFSRSCNRGIFHNLKSIWSLLLNQGLKQI